MCVNLILIFIYFFCFQSLIATHFVKLCLLLFIADEMWKQCTIPLNQKRPHDRKISTNAQSAHHFSVDCARANKGMLAGTLVIVLTIISLIMFYVLNIPLYYTVATLEITVCEMILYVVTSLAVIGKTNILCICMHISIYLFACLLAFFSIYFKVHSFMCVI